MDCSNNNTNTNNSDNTNHTYNITIDMTTGETITEEVGTNNRIVTRPFSCSDSIDDLTEFERKRAHIILNDILLLLEKIKQRPDHENKELLQSMPLDTAVTILTVLKIFDEEKYEMISALTGIEAEEIAD
jgi:hypothetical protein